MKIARSPSAVAIIGLFAMNVEAAGIDCAKPGSTGDHMICRDKSLLARDAIVSDLYAAALKHDDAGKIPEQQRHWITTLQSCSDAECIRQAYDDRIASLVRTKGGQSASMDFQSNSTDGNEGHLAIFGPVGGFLAVSLASTFVGPGGADAGDVNADGIDGVVPLTREHAELTREACKIGLDRLNARTWRVSQAGVCDFADGVTLKGTYRKE